MCCHRLVIYTTCGHSFYSSRPLVECRNASMPPDGVRSTQCELFAHPYKSWRLERLCPSCEHKRDGMLAYIERSQEVHFDEWRWKVSYGLPAHGKDYWTQKMEDREAALAKERGSKMPSKRFGWRRSKNKSVVA